MSTTGTTRKALLCQLEPSIERELKSVLTTPQIQMEADTCQDVKECVRKAKSNQPQVVFCSSAAILLRLRRSLAKVVPVIVVSRNPETKEWLDAIEAGAS